MSRDEVNCSSAILSVVAECSATVFDDVGVINPNPSPKCLRL